MKEIIYVAFWFNSHWCAGVMEIKNDQITFWKDGKYVTEAVERVFKDGKDRTIKTKTGTILLITSGKVRYFVNNKLTTLHRK